jgi:hypothetical protein
LASLLRRFQFLQLLTSAQAQSPPGAAIRVFNAPCKQSIAGIQPADSSTWKGFEQDEARKMMLQIKGGSATTRKRKLAARALMEWFSNQLKEMVTQT